MSGNKPDLLPCPFCGGEALNVEWVTSHDERGWAVACKNSECLMNQGARILRTEAEAAEAWNRRAERTCRAIYDGDDSGHEFRYYEPSYVPNFCPECGAKVVEE
ncbi:Lar family restriction alleviation protein [Collinsella bouchesdurhonensis]|uniref:Lar family restriction alleviation protein n=1 Tax=Collinsella bouchesdurhonensis TaxID=1907654 RepID=UPI00096A40C3|nr:Lar family restriction alleviation protein [Collinsella bouchesdurhonensis]